MDNKERSQSLLSLRPEINYNEDISAELESFQNHTIRPILKFQHQLTIQLLYSNRLYPKISKLEERSAYTKAIKELLSNDNAIRNQLIGIVLGMMTVEEYTVYETLKSEYKKRIFSMQAKRYVDTQFPYG